MGMGLNDSILLRFNDVECFWASSLASTLIGEFGICLQQREMCSLEGFDA